MHSPIADEPAPTARAAAHLLVSADDLRGDVVTLTTAAHHHLSRVQRLRPGEVVTLTDGAGSLSRGVVPPDFASSPALCQVEHLGVTPRRASPIGVGFALVKGDKPELVVQKLTELGVDRIVVFEADRSVARWDAAKRSRGLERLRAISVEALQQSRGVFLPTVEWGVLGELLSDPSTVRADFPGRPLDRCRDRLVLVGPEGGWSDAERTASPGAVAFSRNVLRAETAAIALGVLLAVTVSPAEGTPA